VPAQDPLLAKNLTTPYSARALSAQIELRVHVLRRDDGTGGLSAGELADLLDALAADFAPAGIYFTAPQVSFIQNTSWYNDPITHADTLLAAYDQAGALDLILGPPTGAVAGKAANIPGTALLLAGDAAGTKALSHLVGHCFGLYDTDETAFGVELPDGSNKGTAGDLVSDTAADPGLSGYVESGCGLSAQFALDHPDHDPDPGNIMSGGRLSCWTGFTAEQVARMLTALEHEPVLLGLRSETIVAYTDYSHLTGLEYYGQPWGAAAVDYDKDGRKDLLISRDNLSGTAMAWWCTHFHQATGTPGFDLDHGAFPGTPPASGTMGFILADFDNDGWTDFYTPNPWGPWGAGGRLYRNDQGVFVDVTSSSGLPTGAGSKSIAASWGDYDCDGLLDLLIVFGEARFAPIGCHIGLYRNLGGSFEDVTSSSQIMAAMGDDMPFLSPLWGDLDGDGNLDLLLLDAGDITPGGYPDQRYTRYLDNNGDGTFTDVTAERFPEAAEFQYNTIAALVDMDNDGDLDVAFHSGEMCGYIENDGGELIVRRRVPTSIYQVAEDLTIADYDLDGRQDILMSYWAQWHGPSYPRLLANRVGSPSHPIYLVDETSLSGLGSQGILYGLGAADYNLDGFADLYLTRTDAGNFFYKAAPDGQSQNNWVGVRLVSEHGGNNYLGIGATVKVIDGPHTQMQIVDGGSGKASQRDPELVFGLGDWAGSVNVLVKWPTGGSKYVNLQPNQYTTIVDEPPVVIESTVEGYIMYHVDTGEQDWVFEWQTTEYCQADWDKVVLFIDDLPARCLPSVTVLAPGMPGVDHIMALPPSGNWVHQLIWRNVPCEPKCEIPFEVRSGVGQIRINSENRRKLSIPSCLQSM
jgi:hypothetical protein